MTTRRLPMAKLWTVALLAISFMLDVDCHHARSQSASSTITLNVGIIPAERNFAWNPGLMSKGGIPNRSTVCATLSPGANIQAALDRSRAGKVVQLSAANHTVNNFLLMHSGIP